MSLLSTELSTKQMSNANSEEIINKRPCPFEGDLRPQLKIHVGPREGANVCDREKELQEIYDVTMELLKKGPKLVDKNVEISCHHGKSRGYHFEPPRFKQMIMNDKLGLEVSNRLIVSLDKQICNNCGGLGTSDRSRCFHCIDHFCTKCLSECSKCSELFCPKCTFTIYEGGEHVECLECYR